MPSGVENSRPGGKAAFEAEVGAQEYEEINNSKEEEIEEQQEIDLVDLDADITESDDTAVTGLQEQNGGEDPDDDLELPPPMKPINEPILVTTANGPSGSAIPSELPRKRVSVSFSFALFCHFPRVFFFVVLFTFSRDFVVIASFLQQSSERSTKILDSGATTADLSEIEQIVKERMVSSNKARATLCVGAQIHACIAHQVCHYACH